MIVSMKMQRRLMMKRTARCMQWIRLLRRTEALLNRSWTIYAVDPQAVEALICNHLLQRNKHVEVELYPCVVVLGRKRQTADLAKLYFLRASFAYHHIHCRIGIANHRM